MNIITYITSGSYDNLHHQSIICISVIYFENLLVYILFLTYGMYFKCEWGTDVFLCLHSEELK